MPARPNAVLGLFFLFVPRALALCGGFRLALLVARLFVMLVLARFLENSSLLQLLLEPLQCAVKRFIRSDLDLSQPYPSPAITFQNHRNSCERKDATQSGNVKLYHDGEGSVK